MKSENMVISSIEKGVKATCNAKWDELTHLLFIQLCENEIKKGNKPGIHFSKDGWKNMVLDFNKLTGSSYNKKQLKNHLDRMKMDYKLWLQLKRGELGIAWDFTKNNFDADDQWWERKVRENKDFAKFRGKDLRLIKEKYPLLFDDMATGLHAWTPSQGPPPPSYQLSATRFLVGEDEEIGDSGDTNDSNEDTDNVLINQEDMSYSPGLKRKSVQGQSSSRKNAKLSASASLQTQIDSLLHVMSNRSSATSAYPEQATVDDCIKLLKDIPGVEPKTRLWNFACNLFLKAEAREVFVRQPDADARLSWVEYNYSLVAPPPPRSLYPPYSVYP